MGRFLALALLVILVLCLVGLFAYGRGEKHHRGDEIGSHGTPPTAVARR